MGEKDSRRVEDRRGVVHCFFVEYNDKVKEASSYLDADYIVNNLIHAVILHADSFFADSCTR